MKKILIFPGSQRRQSLNRRLASHFECVLNGGFHVEILDAESVDLPLFNQDFETDDSVIDKIIPIYQRFLEADGLIVVSPEYNGSLTPYLKNTVDWVSRLPRIDTERGYINPFYNKPMLLASATAGRSGGLLGLQSARNLFAYIGCLMLAEQITLPHAAEAWDVDGSLIDPYLQADIAQTLNRFGLFVERLPIFS